jgi:membrane-associated phospholipid phosphatase
VTQIRATIDPDWLPLLPTPPFPSYASGHSTQSGAAATVLTALLGEIAFTDHTHDARGLPPRSFTSFDAAAEEAAVSRLYAGIHYRFDNDAGLEAGRCVGRKILRRVRWRW